MNYLFISPNYPAGHWRYTAALRDAGHNVYGIGDAGSETFPAELRGNLTDYYRVGDLHNYDEVYKGCCYFISRYGRFDAVDSLNPYWCDLVAAVKHDFLDCPTTPAEQYAVLRASQMFEAPEQRLFPAEDADAAAALAEAVGGYPVLLIPAKDKRLGVRRVDNEDDLRIIVGSTDAGSWNMRRFAEGEPLSVDCLCNCRVEPELGVSELVPVAWGIHAFGSDGDGRVWSYPVSDNALEQLAANVLPELFADRTGLVFFHADCVKLQKAVKGLGKKGDIVLNEWWQCTPHEFIIDLMNIEYDCDLRAIWASGEAPEQPLEQKYCAGIACRSFERSYKNPHEKIMRRLAAKLRLHGRTHVFDAGTFLDYHYIFSGADVAELKRSIRFITEDHKEPPRPEQPKLPEKTDEPDSAPAEQTTARDGFAERFAKALEQLESAEAQTAAQDAGTPAGKASSEQEAAALDTGADAADEGVADENVNDEDIASADISGTDIPEAEIPAEDTDGTDTARADALSKKKSAAAETGGDKTTQKTNTGEE